MKNEERKPGNTLERSATANQFRLLIHTAAYWLLHTLRGLAPKTSFWRTTVEFAG